MFFGFFAGIILELRFNFFLWNDWKPFYSSITNDYKGLKRYGLGFINFLLMLVRFSYFLLFSSVIIFWYILLFSLIGFLLLFFTTYLLFFYEIIDVYLFGVISAVIALFGTLLLINSNRKKPIEDKRLEVYDQLIAKMVETLPKIKEGEELGLGNLLSLCITYGSYKVTFLLKRISIMSKESLEKKEQLRLLRHVVFLISVIRFEIEPKRNIIMSLSRNRETTVLRDLIYSQKNIKYDLERSMYSNLEKNWYEIPEEKKGELK